MTKPTGRPAGRPKGATNKASREQRERAAASGMLPHEFLLSVTRGEPINGYVPSFAERLEAAKAAAPFYAPKLSNVQADLNHGGPLVPVLNVNTIPTLTDEQIESYIRREIEREGKLQ